MYEVLIAFSLLSFANPLHCSALCCADTGLWVYWCCCLTLVNDCRYQICITRCVTLQWLVQAFVSVNWLLAEEPVDLETELAWDFLDYLMLGTTAAPLRRAMTESGLGESIIGGGLSGELRQPTFSLGLKGVDPTNAQKVTLPLPVAHRLHKDLLESWRFSGLPMVSSLELGSMQLCALYWLCMCRLQASVPFWTISACLSDVSMLAVYHTCNLSAYGRMVAFNISYSVGLAVGLRLGHLLEAVSHSLTHGTAVQGETGRSLIQCMFDNIAIVFKKPHFYTV